MSNEASTIVLEGFLAGAFDVFNAMLPQPLRLESDNPEDMNISNIGAALSDNPVVLRGLIQNNLGAAALLLPKAIAAHLAALIGETPYDGGEVLDAAGKDTLKETAESALGSGVTNLMQRFGRAVEQLERVELIESNKDESAALFSFMGNGGVLGTFSFTDDGKVSGTGVALCSQSLVALVPERLLTKKGEKPLLSQNEVKDILGGLDTGANAVSSDDTRKGHDIRLNRVLDIRLVAQARLGRVDMPISQLLTLGPGSVVDVGHLVDEPIELLVNDKLIARGDVVVVDEKFGLRITEIISPEERIESLR